MSAQKIALFSLVVNSAAALAQNRFVDASGAHAATDLFGVTVFSAASAGQAVTVDVLGTSIVEAGGAIPVGTKYVIADAQGRAVVGGDASACAGKLIRGQNAAAAGDLVEVLLCLTV